jgi:hypothetical protein
MKVLARSRERLQRARRPPQPSPAALPDASGPADSRPAGAAAALAGAGADWTEVLIGLYNKYLMDFCNCLWRGRALPTSAQVS